MPKTRTIKSRASLELDIAMSGGSMPLNIMDKGAGVRETMSARDLMALLLIVVSGWDKREMRR